MTKQEFRAKLIANATRAEIALLYALSNDKQLKGKYKYQYIFDPYIVDFYFPDYSLIVELDGWSHDYNHHYDDSRTKYIKKTYNIKDVIRFSNKEVHQEIRTVVNSIKKFIPSSGKKNIRSFYGVNPKAMQKPKKKHRINYRKKRTY